jgi:hypothetical protein
LRSNGVPKRPPKKLGPQLRELFESLRKPKKRLTMLAKQLRLNPRARQQMKSLLCDPKEQLEGGRSERRSPSVMQCSYQKSQSFTDQFR